MQISFGSTKLYGLRHFRSLSKISKICFFRVEEVVIKLRAPVAFRFMYRLLQCMCLKCGKLRIASSEVACVLRLIKQAFTVGLDLDSVYLWIVLLFYIVRIQPLPWLVP